MPCKLSPNTQLPIQALLRFKCVRNGQNWTSLSASSSSSAGISTSVEATGLHSPGGQLNQTLPRMSILVLSPGLNTMETVSEEEKGNNKAVVCVTGGSGYIASWLVKLLLQRGYFVRATVRDPADPKKTEHLLALDGAKERLQLFRAELMEQGSFDSVVNGCDGVFHVASPVFATAADPQAEIIDPAVEGSLNVLRSCAKVPSIKRVVLTSSMAAVMFNGKPLVPGAMVDESWFSDIKFCEETKAWYKLSKILAEKAASDFAQQNKIDLVTLDPGTVFGPLLQPTMNASVEVLFNLVNGSQTYPNRCFRFVDVRDVAHAHVLAFENPSAGGRYCIVATVITCHEVLRILRTLYPTTSLPNKCDYEKPFGPADLATSIYQVSRERAEELGVKFTAVEATIRDTVESLNERGFLQIPLQKS